VASPRVDGAPALEPRIGKKIVTIRSPRPFHASPTFADLSGGGLPFTPRVTASCQQACDAGDPAKRAAAEG